VKRIVVIGLIVGVVAILGTATLVTAWGGIRALRAANAPAVSSGTGRGFGANPLQGEGARGNRGDLAFRRDPRAGDEVHEWTIIEGKVLDGTDAGSDILVETADGARVQVGTGPGWLTSQGFELDSGDQVTVQGFWEDGEFKAGAITRERDGAKIALRDESGRPLWAGSGRRALASQGNGNRSRFQPGGSGRRLSEPGACDEYGEPFGPGLGRGRQGGRGSGFWN
jgi:hypothetical protein